MKDLIVGDKLTVARLAGRLQRAQTRAEYQRIQCVLIRATLGAVRAVAGVANGHRSRHPLKMASRG